MVHQLTKFQVLRVDMVINPPWNLPFLGAKGLTSLEQTATVKASSSQAWLWHCRLSHLHFDTINLLSKYDIVTDLPKLKFIKDHLCSSCELGKAKRTEFLNKTLHAYFAQEGIEHQTSTARTPEQNGVVERRNHTLVEAARTMLSAAKVPLYFWAKAIATACFTQNRSLVIPRHEKTPYHIINGRKPFVKFFYIFGSLCYIVRDGENLDKMKEKGDAYIPPLNIQTTPKTKNQVPTRAPTVTSTENINQAETQKENAQVEEDEFINIFSTPVQECGETSSRYVDSSKMHTFYQRHPSEHR
ncbi:retrovirus-related pol polyprotein from transposon TNT 1-94 [Tanacetum coccineum]|uniref:Retrovirus-related pol polyprotein from transposon TNT 1-94 n=1 Tax=Tanacetum coccineum TaxID=301880 RepID=A0ABQ5JD26_9ASTR